jgi:hypothetical protein
MIDATRRVKRTFSSRVSRRDMVGKRTGDSYRHGGDYVGWQ